MVRATTQYLPPPPPAQASAAGITSFLFAGSKPPPRVLALPRPARIPPMGWTHSELLPHILTMDFRSRSVISARSVLWRVMPSETFALATNENISTPPPAGYL
jgi:hypothetical protein